MALQIASLATFVHEDGVQQAPALKARCVAIVDALKPTNAQTMLLIDMQSPCWPSLSKLRSGRTG
jgi:hypothetical protein